MSTQPLERRRIRPVGRRGELRRIGTVLAVLAGVFAIAFAIGHIRRGGETVVEQTPPRLSAVPKPLGASLASAPAIKLAVAKPPPPKPSAPAKSSATPTQVESTPASSTPAPVTPAPTVQPVAPPAKAVTPPTPSPSPSPRSSGGSGSGGGGGGSGGSGGGSGTSFESSG